MGESVRCRCEGGCGASNAFHASREWLNADRDVVPWLRVVSHAESRRDPLVVQRLAMNSRLAKKIQDRMMGSTAAELNAPIKELR